MRVSTGLGLLGQRSIHSPYHHLPDLWLVAFIANSVPKAPSILPCVALRPLHAGTFKPSQQDDQKENASGAEDGNQQGSKHFEIEPQPASRDAFGWYGGEELNIHFVEELHESVEEIGPDDEREALYSAHTLAILQHNLGEAACDRENLRQSAGDLGKKRSPRDGQAANAQR